LGALRKALHETDPPENIAAKPQSGAGIFDRDTSNDLIEFTQARRRNTTSAMSASASRRNRSVKPVQDLAKGDFAALRVGFRNHALDRLGVDISPVHGSVFKQYQRRGHGALGVRIAAIGNLLLDDLRSLVLERDCDCHDATSARHCRIANMFSSIVKPRRYPYRPGGGNFLRISTERSPSGV
jgi:hypothetical protein